jgi:hypothetical protein
MCIQLACQRSWQGASRREWPSPFQDVQQDKGKVKDKCNLKQLGEAFFV